MKIIIGALYGKKRDGKIDLSSTMRVPLAEFERKDEDGSSIKMVTWCWPENVNHVSKCRLASFSNFALIDKNYNYQPTLNQRNMSNSIIRHETSTENTILNQFKYYLSMFPHEIKSFKKAIEEIEEELCESECDG